MRYSIVFDTNTLFTDYNKNNIQVSDFTLPQSFYNVIDSIENLGISDSVSVIIPKVVWEELQIHFKSNYFNKYKKLNQKLKYLNFPNFRYSFSDFEVDEDNMINENEFINSDGCEKICEYIIGKYEKKIKQLAVTVGFIDYPSVETFDKIIKKSLSKKPPFEGKDKKSDKGFKDALIWESILEYKKNEEADGENDDSLKIILYCNDNLMTDKLLLTEYKDKFNEDLIVVKNEQEVKMKLSSIQKMSRDNLRITDDMSIEDYEYLTKGIDGKNFKQTLLEDCKEPLNEKGYILEDIASLIPSNIISENNYSASKQYELELDTVFLVNNVYVQSDEPSSVRSSLSIKVEIIKNKEIKILEVGEITL